MINLLKVFRLLLLFPENSRGQFPRLTLTTSVPADGTLLRQEMLGKILLSNDSGQAVQEIRPMPSESLLQGSILASDWSTVTIETSHWLAQASHSHCYQ